MENIEITAEINSDALEKAFEAMTDNVWINGAKKDFSDWEDAANVSTIYGIALDDQSAQIIDRMIASKGASLAIDMPAVELAVYGQNYAGSFWDRAAKWFTVEDNKD